MVAGRIPLPPRYAFGVFYSRYWAYDDIGEMVKSVCLSVMICNVPLKVSKQGA